MKNKSSIFTGILTAIISLLFLPELFQLLVATILGVQNTLDFWLFIPRITLINAIDTQLWSAIITGFAPFLYLIIICETGSFILSKTYAGFYRYSLIIFLLINIGYLLVYSFSNSVIVILNLQIITDWKSILVSAGIKDLKYLIYIFFIIILTAGYLNLITKRVLKYVNVQE